MPSIPPGTRFGPYEIVALVGAGGMGDVYRARDTRLDRAVAIKVLPQAFATDGERRQRFEREARVIASLSHPHICALHDVGSHPGDGEPAAYLVMEYLEGTTLAERLARGPLSIAETLQYGRDIAAALAAAHRKNIVHRDLKPANVMLTPSGVKLLDFGLAAPAAFEHVGTATTTDLGRITMPAAVLGTLPYMAPEQIEGRGADHRTDIFALGAVMHEMTTGRRTFNGDSSASLASSILTSEPSAISASPPLDRVVRGCLEKDPDKRWQSAHDVSRMLAALVDRDDQVARSVGRKWLPWTIAAAAILSAVAIYMFRARPGSASPDVVAGPIAFPIPPPPGGRFRLHVEYTSAAVSPDGTRIAFSATDQTGPRLWVRTLAEEQARPLEGSEGATSLFWSPDGRQLAFFAEGRLQRIDLEGGAPVTICTVREGVGQTGSWSPDGRILFASVTGEAILSVPWTGGSPQELVRPDAARQETRTTAPMFLPDGKRFLYLAGFADDTGALMMGGTGASVEIVRARSTAVYIDAGYLLFAHDSTLVAQRFDPATGRVTGEMRPIANPVNRFPSTGTTHFSASRSGNVMVFQSHLDEHRLVWFDRAGKRLSDVSTRGRYLNLRLSADGQEVSFARTDRRLTTWDAWTLSLARGNEAKLTDDPGTEIAPLTVGNRWLIYSGTRSGPPRLIRRDLSTGTEQALFEGAEGMQWASDVSPDGQWILYNERTGLGTFDLMLRHITDGRVRPYIATVADDSEARISPDGRAVAFVSDRSGTPEVYVARFPDPGVPVIVSSGGGYSPRWSRDGRELLYLSSQGLMAVAFKAGEGSASAARPVRLFQALRWNEFDVAADGRLLAIVAEEIAAERPLTALINWPAQNRR